MTSGDLTRYRVMAWVTGVLLVLLVAVAMPLRYLGGDPTLVHVIGPVHGWMYVLYLLTAGILAYKLRWSPRRTVLVVLAGTVPLASFVAERSVAREVRPLLDRAPAALRDS